MNKLPSWLQIASKGNAFLVTIGEQKKPDTIRHLISTKTGIGWQLHTWDLELIIFFYNGFVELPMIKKILVWFNINNFLIEFKKYQVQFYFLAIQHHKMVDRLRFLHIYQNLLPHQFQEPPVQLASYIRDLSLVESWIIRIIDK